MEADGQLAAERLNSAAAELVAAQADWERVASQILSLIMQVARPAPGDVSYPRATEAARAVLALASLGGEEGPRLDRSRPPWAALLGEHEGAGDVDELRSVPA